MEDIKIGVASHKKGDMPTDKMYLPLHVGAAGKFNLDGSPTDFGYKPSTPLRDGLRAFAEWYAGYYGIHE